MVGYFGASSGIEPRVSSNSGVVLYQPVMPVTPTILSCRPSAKAISDMLMSCTTMRSGAVSKVSGVPQLSTVTGSACAVPNIKAAATPAKARTIGW